MSRRPMVAGNIKMNLTVESVLELLRGVLEGLKGGEAAEVVYFPPFTALADAGRLLRDAPIGLGAQDLHWDDEGAFTGEISPRMLLDVGCRYVMIGHSERRTLFGETDEGVNRKTKAALSARSRRRSSASARRWRNARRGRTERGPGPAGRSGPGRARRGGGSPGLVVAYEPVWAIGTGRTATPARPRTLTPWCGAGWRGLGPAVAAALRILYGGSVKPDNAPELLGQPDVDGALVGGACLAPQSFLSIIRAAG